jgi:hypothetical protein
MSSLHIDTAEQRTAFEPGAEIEVYLEWDLDEPAEAVELRLVWNTSGKGTTDIAVADTVRFDAPSQRESRQATLTLPTSPYSFSGTLVSLIWALELVALPGGESARQEITIGPGGEEVVITAAEGEGGE